MAGVSFNGLPPAPPIDRFREEGRQLRADLVRAQLNICITIASFSECLGVSDKLRASSYRAAESGCQIIRTQLPMASGEMRRELLQKLEWLEARRGNGEIGKSPLAVSECEEEEVEVPLPSAIPGENGLATAPEKLTRRELEVLKHIAEGNSTKRVAEMLGITFKTAACHRYRVMDKLGIHETANLVRYAIRQGLIQA